MGPSRKRKARSLSPPTCTGSSGPKTRGGCRKQATCRRKSETPVYGRKRKTGNKTPNSPITKLNKPLLRSSRKNADRLSETSPVQSLGMANDVKKNDGACTFEKSPEIRPPKETREANRSNGERRMTPGRACKKSRLPAHRILCLSKETSAEVSRDGLEQKGNKLPEPLLDSPACPMVSPLTACIIEPMGLNQSTHSSNIRLESQDTAESDVDVDVPTVEASQEDTGNSDCIKTVEEAPDTDCQSGLDKPPSSTTSSAISCPSDNLQATPMDEEDTLIPEGCQIITQPASSSPQREPNSIPIIMRRKKLRSEVTGDMLWEGIQDVSFPRLKKRSCDDAEDMAAAMAELQIECNNSISSSSKSTADTIKMPLPLKPVKLSSSLDHAYLERNECPPARQTLRNNETRLNFSPKHPSDIAKSSHKNAIEESSRDERNSIVSVENNSDILLPEMNTSAIDLQRPSEAKQTDHSILKTILQPFSDICSRLKPSCTSTPSTHNATPSVHLEHDCITCERENPATVDDTSAVPKSETLKEEGQPSTSRPTIEVEPPIGVEQEANKEAGGPTTPVEETKQLTPEVNGKVDR